MESENGYFQVADFVIFGGILFSSALIGIYFAYKDRRDETTENYYFGGRTVSPILVAISLSVSFISAIAVISIPVEIYLFGVVWTWSIFAEPINFFVASKYYIPLYRRLRLKTVFEYLDLRFHPGIRYFSSAISMVALIFYLGITVYLPSLALSAVTLLELRWTIAITSIVCTFYTTIGGLKAVMWTDVLQALIMLGGILSVFIYTTLLYGGFGLIWKAAERGGRLNFFKFDIDPRIRSTAWSRFIGTAVGGCYLACCNQVTVQRYLSCDSVRSSRAAVWLQWIPTTILMILCVGNGLVLYAYYEGCDPVLSGLVEKSDQAIPRLALEVFQDMPGMTGMFVAATFSGTLSTVSSGVNSLSALALEDFVLRFFPAISKRKKILCSKFLSLLFGAVIMGIAYLVSTASSNILQVNVAVASISTPILGVFTMGLFMPWINSWGALAGVVSGTAFNSWIAISASSQATFSAASETLPISTDNCTANSAYDVTTMSSTGRSTDLTNFSEMSTISEEEGSVLGYTLYSLSPYLYGTCGFLVSIFFGHVASFLTGFNKISEANPDLFVPFINSKLFRFGIPESTLVDGENMEQQKTVRYINAGYDNDENNRETSNSNMAKCEETIF
ncbi:sodium-coupled monocarboxylate transporter 2-like [Styela clava]